MRVPIVLSSLLLVALLPAVPADHIGGMELAAASDGRTALLEWTLEPTGKKYGGILRWTTGDGASGRLWDGFEKGTFKGEGSGTGRLSDGRPFTWTRAGPDPVVISVAYDYRADGIFRVDWSDCCPRAAGSAELVVSADGRPQNLAVAPGERPDEAILTWRAPSQTGLTGYRLLHGVDGGDLTPRGDFAAGGESWTVAGLAPGALHAFALRSLLGEREGGTSNVVELATPSLPGAPQGTVARSGPARGEIELTWEPPADAGGRPVTGFRVYRGHEPEALVLLADVAGLRLVDEGLPDGITRHYRVAAVSDVGEGPLGGLASAATFPPDAPPPALPTPRAFTGAAHGGLNSFVFGGLDEQGRPLAEIVVFDPYANTLRTLETQLPGARYGAGATWVPDGHVHTDGIRPLYCDPVCVRGVSVIGGGRGSLPGGEGPLSSPGLEVLAFDAASGTVQSVATLPSARSHAALAYADGAVVMAGGQPSACASCGLDEIVEIDPHDWTVVVAARLPAPLAGVAAAADGERVLLLGGEANGVFSDAIHLYDPDTNTLSASGVRLPSPRAHATAVWTGSAFLLMGGRGPDGALDEILRIDPAAATVEIVGRLPDAAWGASGVFDGQHAYHFGGQTAEGITDQVVRHRPGAPVGVAAEAGPDFGQATVRWEPPPGGEPSAFRIYRSVAGEPFALRAEVAAQDRAWVDEELADGADVAYRVSALTPSGEGPHSEPAGVRTWTREAPNAPQNVRWNTALAGAVVRWDAPQPNGGPPLMGYVVVRLLLDPDDGTYTVERETDVGLVHAHEDPDAIPGLHRWEVSGYNLAGRGAAEGTGPLPEASGPP